MALKSVIVGTAGHIDHGKTALVKALTGIDADRLEEEKRRGITIDIGFAHLELPDANGNLVSFGFIDVPGHERFIRNMLAGVGGIDVVMLIIAADEGIKPQTREHFEICKLLGIDRGITVITKSDKVTPAVLTATCANVEQFLRGSFLDSAQSPIIAVSSVTEAGIDDLKNELLHAASQITPRNADANLRLPIDRVFSMRGFGTVATGTLVSGRVQLEDEVELLPSGRRARVRGIQVHNQPVDRAVAGQRTALNLAGAEKAELARGMTLVAPGLYRTTSLIDAHIHLLGGAKPPRSGMHFHLHNHTSETVSTVQLFSAAQNFARFRLATPMFLLPGDRFILRQFSPLATIGGGEILDAVPIKQVPSVKTEDFLGVMHAGDDAKKFLARIKRRGSHGLSIADAIVETGWTRGRVETVAAELGAAQKVERATDRLVTAEHLLGAQTSLLRTVEGFHSANPLAAGISREELRSSLRVPAQIFAAAVSHLLLEKKLAEKNERISIAGHSVTLSDDEAKARATIEKAFASAGLAVPALKDVLSAMPLDRTRAHSIVSILLRERALIKLGDGLVFHASALDSLRDKMRAYKTTSPTIDVTHFKRITGVSRKYAIPLLEFLDRERITRRQGDLRVIL